VKILVLQLARLGDVFQTWPALRSLNRAGCEVHLLVRPRFKAATKGLKAVHQVHEFKTDEVLGPVLTRGKSGLVGSMAALDQLLANLDAQKFDRIINLSFSPLSSWITYDLEMRSFLRGKAVMSVGYTRHADGSLAIPDDASAYFFAQVGSRSSAFPDEALNRIPLPRLFSTIASAAVPEAELKIEDWCGPEKAVRLPEALIPRGKFVAIHIGASTPDKTLDAASWSQIIQRLHGKTNLDFVLLGSPEERAKSEDIYQRVLANGLSARHLANAVGCTNVEELFPILERSEILIAGDSALIHVASLVGTKVLNLSSRSVSHWETGPLSPGSRIVVYGGAAPTIDLVVSEAVAMVSGESQTAADRTIKSPLEEIPTVTNDAHSDFLWSFVSGLYMGTPFGIPEDSKFAQAVEQWLEIADVEQCQLEALSAIFARVEEDENDQEGKHKSVKTIASVLDRVDDLANLIVGAEPRLAPLARWLNTEKSRLGPLAQADLVQKHREINLQLRTVLARIKEAGEAHDRFELGL
jgi:heptosyltransferase-3